jgi:hypothetical protein
MAFYEMIPQKLFISGILAEDDWEFVRRTINVVVNVTTRPDRLPSDLQSITYYWFPMTIWVAPTLKIHY